MAALSMVIIASVIGGFDDIGWEVLSTMRKARFGESLMAGSIIVLIAVVMDRISAAYASREVSATADKSQPHMWWSAIGVLAAVAVIINLTGLDIKIDSPAWSRAVAEWLNTNLEAFVVAYGQLPHVDQEHDLFLLLAAAQDWFRQIHTAVYLGL